MKTSKKWQSLGLALGVALAVAGGLRPLISGAQEPGMKKSTPPTQRETAPARALSQAFETAALQVKPAVVSVFSEKSIKMNPGDFALPFGDDFFQQFFGRPFEGPRGAPSLKRHEYSVPQRGMGSGMILDKEGHILTNNHVVRDVDKIKVQLPDKREFPAEIVGADAKSDVAIIRIKGKVPDNLPTVKLGKSEDLKVGDWVLAVGAPFGLTQTVTAGIISATGRSNVGISDYEDFLQTDAAINPGNSGGPLVNMDGEVIGMNTAIATSFGQFAGVGFAIPSDVINSYLPTLLKGSTITRGFLGIGIQDVSVELAKKFDLPNSKGALVSQVAKDSPADKAGLKSGDVIVRFKGKTIEDARELRKLAAATEPGSKADVTVMRDGTEKSLSVNAGKMPEPQIATAKNNNEETPAESDNLEKLGMTVQPLTPQLAQELGEKGQDGVVISRVEQGSPAALAGLQAGDLITEVNRHPVNQVGQLRQEANATNDNLLLLVKRKDASMFVVLKLG
ncbi:MAG TPA: Do family serine endopeptidase [Verrucomicrobiaceae bacterium]